MNSMRRNFLIEPPATPLPASRAFLRHARFRLREDYPVKIRRAVESIDETRLWWRPNEASNSIGNLLLHLAGNLRQWIVAGVGGAPDDRDRDAEFARREGLSRQELLALLQSAIEEADAVLENIEREIENGLPDDDAALQRLCRPQGFPQTVLDAIFHPIEHFSYHTGQIVQIAKLLEADRIRFYDDRRLAGES